jgi:hypothetical protein
MWCPVGFLGAGVYPRLYPQQDYTSAAVEGASERASAASSAPTYLRLVLPRRSIAMSAM